MAPERTRTTPRRNASSQEVAPPSPTDNQSLVETLCTALTSSLGATFARLSESLEAKVQETLARATAGSGLSVTSGQQVLNSTPEVSTQASTGLLGHDATSPATMVPAGAHLWVHGGSKAWKPMDTGKLRNFQVTRHSHSDLEDVFLESED